MQFTELESCRFGRNGTGFRCWSSAVSTRLSFQMPIMRDIVFSRGDVGSVDERIEADKGYDNVFHKRVAPQYLEDKGPVR